MGKNPAFQFYPNDWSRDLEEHPLEIEGAWIRLCCKLWWSDTRGKMTRTMTQWARILRESESDTDRILDYLEKQKIGDINRNGNGDVTVMSRRMLKDEKEKELTRLRVQKHREKQDCNGSVTEMKHHSSSSSSSSYTKVHKKKDLISLPEWLDKTLWEDFRDHRKKLRKPMTPRAEEILIKKLESLKDEGHNPKHLLITAIERGWQSVFAPNQ